MVKIPFSKQRVQGSIPDWGNKVPRAVGLGQKLKRNEGVDRVDHEESFSSRLISLTGFIVTLFL